MNSLIARAGQFWQARSRRQQAWLAGGTLTLVGGALALSGIAFRVWLAGVRRGWKVARWWLLLVTFRLYQPCADCHKYIHANARICHRCGFRRR